MAAASAAGAALEVGRGDSNAAFAAAAGGADAAGAEAADAEAADVRGGVDAVVEPGSGVMMLTGGVEAAVGNSALVGLPVGTDDESAATGAAAAGAFHDGA